MKIDRLELIGFGRFSGRGFDFAPGFSLVYGPNEAGKSTLISFIELMLYGAKKDGLSKRLYLPAHEQYQPWGGGAYQGRLTFSLAAGRTIELFRNFDKERDEISLHDAVLGKEITGDFPQNRRGEILFAQELLGMTRSVFLNTVMIPQMGLTRGIEDPTSELQQDLLKALAGGVRDRSAASAMELLRKALDRIGRTDRGKRDAELNELLGRLEEELKEAVTQRKQLQLNRERAHATTLELGRAQALLDTLEWRQAHDRAAELEQRIKRARELQARVETESVSLEQYLPFKDVDLRNSEKAVSLEDQVQTARKKIDELQKKVNEFEEELRASKEEVKNLNSFRGLPHQAVQEMIELRTRWHGARESIGALRSEVEANMEKVREKQNRHDELASLLGALGEDAGERIEDLNRREKEISDELESLTDRAGEESVRQGPQRAMSAAGIVVAIVGLVAAGALYGLDYFGILKAGGLWMIPAGIAFISLLLSVIFRKRGGELKASIEEKSLRYEEMLEQRRAIRKERSTIFSIATVKDYDGFLKLRAEFEALKESLADNAILIQQKRLPHLEDEMEQLRFQIASRLKGVGIPVPRDLPGDDEINRFIESVQRVQDLEEKHQIKLDRRNEMKQDLERLQREFDSFTRELSAMYRAAESRNYADFMSRCEGRRAYDKHLANLERQRDNLENLLHGSTVEDLEKELAGLRQIVEHRAHEAGETAATNGTRLEEVKARAEDLRRELDTLGGIIETMERTVRDPGLIEVELASAREELDRIARRRSALNIALECLEEATTRLHASIAPLINETIGAISGSLTGGRYRDVKVDDSFAVRVRAPETGGIVPVQSLSAGARDQLYFAARLALADALSQGREAAPLLLDDSFVEYDEPRAREALRTLQRISAERQVLLFTCHERERALARDIFSDALREIDLDLENAGA